MIAKITLFLAISALLNNFHLALSQSWMTDGLANQLYYSLKMAKRNPTYVPKKYVLDAYNVGITAMNQDMRWARILDGINVQWIEKHCTNVGWERNEKIDLLLWSIGKNLYSFKKDPEDSFYHSNLLSQYNSLRDLFEQEPAASLKDIR